MTNCVLLERSTLFIYFYIHFFGNKMSILLLVSDLTPIFPYVVCLQKYKKIPLKDNFLIFIVLNYTSALYIRQDTETI